MKSQFKKGKEKNQKPLWLLGFLRRSLNRFAMLASCTDLDIERKDGHVFFIFVYTFLFGIDDILHKRSIYYKRTSTTKTSQSM